MCGLVGVLARLGATPQVGEQQLLAMGSRMATRGPDGSGFAASGPFAVVHQRLAVVGLGSRGAQPVRGPRWILAYNGELYDTANLRGELVARGLVDEGETSDTVLLAQALEAFGPSVLSSLRGMFAFAAWDTLEERLILARDGLGVKPMYWWSDGRELVFGSDVRAILAHPAVGIEPDLEGISAYLTTVRLNRPEGTLFENVRCLQPGTMLECIPTEHGLQTHDHLFDAGSRVDPTWTAEAACEALRVEFEQSVRHQLVAEVPVCSLLSGGIDSSWMAAIAEPIHGNLRTYAAGVEQPDGDLEHARLMARKLGTNHQEAVLTQSAFLEGWQGMIREGGLPLSTPNEVAILTVARRLRKDGCIVTLSGEGADELLGGYQAVLEACEAYEAAGRPGLSPGRFQLELAAWISPALKEKIMRPDIYGAIGGDEALFVSQEAQFLQAVAAAGPGADPLDAHLRMQRAMNLTSLLERLDRSTMLASVEGRVPFADQRMRDLCESFPARLKFPAVSVAESAPGNLATLPRAKRILRAAAAPCLPHRIVARPKASFPLPFESWSKPLGPVLRSSGFAQALFHKEFVDEVARDPEQYWAFAWPMLNIAMWGDAWFG